MVSIAWFEIPRQNALFLIKANVKHSQWPFIL